MQRLGLFEILVSHIAHKSVLAAVCFLTLALGSQKISFEKNLHFESDAFQIELAHFSPAFAAFEDDFLFPEIEETELAAGESDQVFTNITGPKTKLTRTTASIRTERPNSLEALFDKFDGGKPLNEVKQEALSNDHALTGLRVAKTKKKQDKIKLASEEMKFGSLVAMVNPVQPTTKKPVAQTPTGKASNPLANAKKPNPPTVQEQGHGDKDLAFDTFKVVGGISLKKGLAFLGSMEVSWVVGDHELQVGSINVPDAEYEIEVSQLIGDIIISLYDNNDELIGEGVFDLTRARGNSKTIFANIEILPIDWDYAGTISHSNSLGTGVNKPVSNVNVALYSFNDSTKTDEAGGFHFYNWKKTNSRTLAIASKEGFRDSIFMLDSKQVANVTLFTEKYMGAFFSFLNDLGIYEVDEKGTVYGSISGIDNPEGLTVRLGKARPIYFMEIGFASIDQKTTSKNGLFAFVGLDDGDYELFVEKQGEILDHRIVVVEQGKVSPVDVNLKNVKKHLLFFDPFEPDREISSVELSFFDGMEDHNLSQENQMATQINRGNDPSLMDFNTPTTPARTFVSRNKNLQKVPFITNKKIIDLADSEDLKIEDGLLIGFVDTTESFRAAMVENPVEKTLYFNEKGELVDPDQSIPYGFIMGGFPKGLSSVFIESNQDRTILGSDLIFSDHDSISVSHFEIFPISN